MKVKFCIALAGVDLGEDLNEEVLLAGGEGEEHVGGDLKTHGVERICKGGAFFCEGNFYPAAVFEGVFAGGDFCFDELVDSMGGGAERDAQGLRKSGHRGGPMVMEIGDEMAIGRVEV